MKRERTVEEAPRGSLLVDAHRPVETVRLDLGEYSQDLRGGDVEIAVEDGGLVVRALHPEGHAMFRAMPNDGIEHHVRLAMRALLLATADHPIRDIDGRRVTATDCTLYPAHMEDAPRIPADHAGRDAKTRLVVTAGILAILMTGILIGAGLAHPLVLLLVPGVGIGAWSLLQATRAHGGAMSLPDYPTHLRRGRAQARSISRAASRARGLST
jgi:hypothetical protein